MGPCCCVAFVFTTCKSIGRCSELSAHLIVIISCLSRSICETAIIDMSDCQVPYESMLVVWRGRLVTDDREASIGMHYMRGDAYGCCRRGRLCIVAAYTDVHPVGYVSHSVKVFISYYAAAC